MPIRFNECRRGFAPKCTLKFNKQITANVYDHQTITTLDILMDTLLKERGVEIRLVLTNSLQPDKTNSFLSFFSTSCVRLCINLAVELSIRLRA